MLLAEREKEIAEVERVRKRKKAKEAEEKKEREEQRAGDAMDVDKKDEGKMENVGDEEGALVFYSSLEAPPSLIPPKRYCDITGLEAPYTDPQTGLRYHDKNIFAYIRTLKPAMVQSFLMLRGGGQPVIV